MQKFKIKNLDFKGMCDILNFVVARQHDPTEKGIDHEEDSNFCIGTVCLCLNR